MLTLILSGLIRIISIFITFILPTIIIYIVKWSGVIENERAVAIGASVFFSHVLLFILKRNVKSLKNKEIVIDSPIILISILGGYFYFPSSLSQIVLTILSWQSIILWSLKTLRYIQIIFYLNGLITYYRGLMESPKKLENFIIFWSLIFTIISFYSYFLFWNEHEGNGVTLLSSMISGVVLVLSIQIFIFTFIEDDFIPSDASMCIGYLIYLLWGVQNAVNNNFMNTTEDAFNLNNNYYYDQLSDINLVNVYSVMMSWRTYDIITTMIWAFIVFTIQFNFDNDFEELNYRRRRSNNNNDDDDDDNGSFFKAVDGNLTQGIIIISQLHMLFDIHTTSPFIVISQIPLFIGLFILAFINEKNK